MADTVCAIQKYCREEMVTGGVCGYREYEDWVWAAQIEGDVCRAARNTVVAKAAPEKEEPKKEEFVVPEKKAEFNAPAETQSAAAETKQEPTTEEAAPVLSDSVKHAARVLEHLRAMEAEQKEQPEVKTESAAPAEEKKEIEEAELSPEPLLSGVTVQDEEEEPPAEEAPE